MPKVSVTRVSSLGTSCATYVVGFNAGLCDPRIAGTVKYWILYYGRENKGVNVSRTDVRFDSGISYKSLSYTFVLSTFALSPLLLSSLS
jgi:hypothetical protein